MLKKTMHNLYSGYIYSRIDGKTPHWPFRLNPNTACATPTQSEVS